MSSAAAAFAFTFGTLKELERDLADLSVSRLIFALSVERLDPKELVESMRLSLPLVLCLS